MCNTNTLLTHTCTQIPYQRLRLQAGTSSLTLTHFLLLFLSFTRLYILTACGTKLFLYLFVLTLGALSLLDLLLLSVSSSTRRGCVSSSKMRTTLRNVLLSCVVSKMSSFRPTNFPDLEITLSILCLSLCVTFPPQAVTPNVKLLSTKDEQNL